MDASRLNGSANIQEEHSPSPQSDDENKVEWLLTFDPIALKYVGRRVNPCIQQKYTKIGHSYNMCFKLVKSDSKLVKAIMFSYGFLQCSSRNQKCNLLWTNTHLSAATMRQLRPWQRVNHFPRSWMLTRKDLLYENVERAAIQYGRDWFNFIPDFFNTPLSAESQQKLRQCLMEVELGYAPPFIVKPVGGSFGRGIFFLDKPEQLDSLGNDERLLLISRYIDRPKLIDGLKWDLRIYVLVTSFYPLIAYVYNGGLARFAVHKYDDGAEANLEDVNRHLTNYSLNKASDAFVRNTDCTQENMGHKWTLGALLRELEKKGGGGVDTGLLMVRIEDILIKSLLAIQPKVAAMCRKLNLHPKCCFELFGFDILIDEDLKPWLLELNLSPSLTCDSPLDSLLKSHLFCNVLNIAQIPLVSDKNAQNQCYEEDEEVPLLCEAVEEEGAAQQMTTASSKSSEVESTGPTSISSVTNVHPSNTTASAQSSLDTITSSSSVCRSNSAESSSSSNGGQSAAKQQKRRNQSPPKSGKVRKVQLTQKVTFSADRITPQYLARLKCLEEKLKSEEKRRGHFTRIFPRKTTWDMYRPILEDSGQERWDEALHGRVFDSNDTADGNGQELAVRDVQLAHEQLMDTAKFKHRRQLDPVVRDVVLAEALSNSDFYRRRMYAGDLQPYPSTLPKVRPTARRRTRSQCEAEEVRRKKLEERKGNNNNDDEDATGRGGSSSPVPPTPLGEVNLNNMDRIDSAITAINEQKQLENGTTAKMNGDGNIRAGGAAVMGR